MSLLFCRVEYGLRQQLLAYGSSNIHVKLCDKSRSPSLNAISFNSHTAVQLLLSMGAFWGAKDIKGNTILYIVAKYADAKTMRILASTASKDIDGRIVNFEQKTTEEVMGERLEWSVEIENRWAELLDACLAETYFGCLC
jgi:hypothetical protein